MPYCYRRTLPAAPLDIIGDVHGEIDALQALLHHLGYRENGSHPKGRKLVFAGDLCDRGPDSPAVLAWFWEMHDAGNAFTVLGNHELNALMHDPKDGSGWFFPERAAKDAALYAPWHTLPAHARHALESRLAEQPLIWARSDVRIVHAAWLPHTFSRLEEARGESLTQQYRRFDRELDAQLQTAPWYADYLREQQRYAEAAQNPHQTPPPMPATAQYELNRSRLHPIRALTSGIEQPAPQPFYAGGRWRYTARCGWWNSYRESVPVLIGHYWRSWRPQPGKSGRENILPAAGNAWHGAKRNVFCTDFSAGARWRDRKQGIPPAQSQFRLAAMCWPERVLVFDNGDIEQTV
ncbi:MULTISPECIES: metallophosphoesterase [Neisseria]|uniref:Calcineurin-like phosphoesterase family protein n=1 Tax=Neisseria musculi TaxID=1815583 RepID=A0A7H1MC16_9NEIS|nr:MULTISPECIES: metallophosphoesterase [Neisseria]MBF0803505.1 metallophosphoesterase [Neisseria sp. 19428wB4_WF04]QNT59181.1 calcineurin-like phosphoesterase family protein [Neisseria musculi]TFU43821.1 serine/threonine protein phosphatase [Neisseria sp. WF04]